MIKKSIKRFALCASLTLGLLFAGAATASAQVIYVGTNPDGSTVWVSCGSSAGYYVMRCPAGGGACTDVTPDR